MNINEIKAIFIAIFAGISAMLGVVAIPFYILLSLNILDYVTGILASHYRSEKINSNRGFRGIVKKITMWILVVVAMIVDWLIIYASANMGLNIEYNYLVAVLVIVWLISNEIISLLENFSDIGTPMPKFLMKLVEQIKDSADR